MPPPRFWKRQDKTSVAKEPPVLPPLGNDINVDLAEITAAVDEVLAKDAKDRQKDERLRSRGVQVIGDDAFLYNGRLYRAKDKTRWECVDVGALGGPAEMAAAAAARPSDERVSLPTEDNYPMSPDKKKSGKIFGWMKDSSGKELKKNLKKRNITVLQETAEGIPGGILDQEVNMFPTPTRRSAELARPNFSGLEVPPNRLLCSSAPPRENASSPFIPHFAAVRPSRPILHTTPPPLAPAPPPQQESSEFIPPYFNFPERVPSASDAMSVQPPLEFPPQNLCVLRMDLLRNQYKLEPREDIDSVLLDVYFPNGNSIRVPREVVTTLYHDLYDAHFEESSGSSSYHPHEGIENAVELDAEEQRVSVQDNPPSVGERPTADVLGSMFPPKENQAEYEDKEEAIPGSESIPSSNYTEKQPKVQDKPRKKGYLDSIFYGTTSATLPIIAGPSSQRPVQNPQADRAQAPLISSINAMLQGYRSQLHETSAQYANADADDDALQMSVRTNMAVYNQSDVDSGSQKPSNGSNSSGSHYSNDPVAEPKFERYAGPFSGRPLRVVNRTTPDPEPEEKIEVQKTEPRHEERRARQGPRYPGLLQSNPYLNRDHITRGRVPQRTRIPQPSAFPQSRKRNSASPNQPRGQDLYDVAQMENNDFARRKAQEEMDFVRHGQRFEDLAIRPLQPQRNRFPVSQSQQAQHLSSQLQAEDVLKHSGDTRYPGPASSINGRFQEHQRPKPGKGASFFKRYAKRESKEGGANLQKSSDSDEPYANARPRGNDSRPGGREIPFEENDEDLRYGHISPKQRRPQMPMHPSRANDPPLQPQPHPHMPDDRKPAMARSASLETFSTGNLELSVKENIAPRPLNPMQAPNEPKTYEHAIRTGFLSPGYTSQTTAQAKAQHLRPFASAESLNQRRHTAVAPGRAGENARGPRNTEMPGRKVKPVMVPAHRPSAENVKMMSAAAARREMEEMAREGRIAAQDEYSARYAAASAEYDPAKHKKSSRKRGSPSPQEREQQNLRGLDLEDAMRRGDYLGTRISPHSGLDLSGGESMLFAPRPPRRQPYAEPELMDHAVRTDPWWVKSWIEGTSGPEGGESLQPAMLAVNNEEPEISEDEREANLAQAEQEVEACRVEAEIIARQNAMERLRRENNEQRRKKKGFLGRLFK
ncbi:hypothetical protein H072_58 [Dactylellina haptotyla CBS 200.50]|uniref:Uncharacterized protein n=1 Tax=Dactylellina haptotyla (strain CBS 200.50) TaxID=1284197 RepID=S8CEA9_DACHA|nr:hypothetical protein H072_58 [Dactylellina haptotyla CBS 200.50]